MWSAQQEVLAGGRAIRFRVELEAEAVSFAEVLRLWREEPAFRTWWGELLAGAPFSAFRWETPPLTAATAGRPFEFVLLDSPTLARAPDAVAFAEHFRAASSQAAIEFSNLGRDAIMVVPAPLGPHSAYGHLAAFVRHAPEPQRHALWSLVGAAMQRRLSATPVWLSTAGAGVSWLHVRLDNRPKYYAHAPYRDEG